MKMRPLLKNPDEYNDPPRPFLEHIVALRACLINAVVSWAVCCLVVGVFSPRVLSWLKSPAEALMKAGKIEIVSLNITGGFSQIMSIAMWGGTALSFPFVMYFVLRFIFPALTRREKFVMMTVLVLGTGLFLGGAFLAYAQTLPLVVSTFQAINDWTGLPVTSGSYVSIPPSSGA